MCTDSRPAAVVVSHLAPRRGGGPLGVLYLVLQTETFKNGQGESRFFSVICGDMAAGGSKPGRRGIFREWDVFRALVGLGKRPLRVVHFGPVRVAALVRLFNKNVRVVYTEHSKGGTHVERRQRSESKARQVMALLDLMLSTLVASEIVFPSRAALELFRERNKWFGARFLSKARIIPNGTNEMAPRDVETSGPPYLLSVAEEVPDKALPEMIETVMLANAGQGEPVQLVMVGTRGPSSALIDQVADNVDFIDRRGKVKPQEVRDLMCGALALLHLPSAAVFDLVILEAMAVGLPVLASPVGGNVEALGEDYDLYVRDAGDLAQCLERLSNATFREEVGRSLRTRHSAFFSVDRMARAYLHEAD